MAQTLDQIYKSLGSIYNPQVDLIRKQQSDIPTQLAAEEQGLGAKQTAAFDQILGGARNRGLGFAGIPLQEQAKYNATEYMPALARLRTSGREQATSLEQAILGIRERQRGQADSLRQQSIANDQWKQTFAFEKQKWAQTLAEQARSRAAAASAGFSPTFGGGSMGGGPTLPAGMTARNDGGFNFTAGNKPVSAATFAKKNNMQLGDILYQMGSMGDQTAAKAYNWIQSIQGTDMWNSGRWKQTPAYQQTFRSLFWS